MKAHVLMMFIGLLCLIQCQAQRGGITWIPTDDPPVSSPRHKPNMNIDSEDAQFFYFKSSGASTASYSHARKIAKEAMISTIQKSIYQEVYRHRQSNNAVLNRQIKALINQKSKSIGATGILIYFDFERSTTRTYRHYRRKKRKATRTTHEVYLKAKYSKLDFQRVINEILNNY